LGEEGCFDALGVGGSQAPVERECLSEARLALAGLALLEVTVSNAFQGAGFLQGRPQGSGDAEGLTVVGTSIGNSQGRAQHPTQTVESLSLTVPAAEVAE
jgi:hypothetical protein